MQQGRVTISPLPHTTSPFKSPYHGKAENDISWDFLVQYDQKHQFDRESNLHLYQLRYLDNPEKDCSNSTDIGIG